MPGPSPGLPRRGKSDISVHYRPPRLTLFGERIHPSKRGRPRVLRGYAPYKAPAELRNPTGVYHMRKNANHIQPRRPNNRAVETRMWAAVRPDPGGPPANDKIQTVGGDTVGPGDGPADAGSAPTSPTKDPQRRALEVIEAINGLDSIGLDEVAAHVGHLLRAKTPKARDRACAEADWLLAFKSILDPLGIATPPPAALAKQSYIASFRKGLSVAEAYVDSMSPKTVAERINGRLIVVRTLIDWMQDKRVPLSFKAAAQNLQNAGTSMQAAYPGYRAAGMLSALVRMGVR